MVVRYETMDDQLVDTKGYSITANYYLKKALKTQLEYSSYTRDNLAGEGALEDEYALRMAFQLLF